MENTGPQDPDGRHFDQAYASMRGADPSSVPWAHGKPHPTFATWLANASPPTPECNRALVVGSGLGDDAEALSERGWNVAAFDISENALSWTRERFPDSRVDYRVANVFDLPATWRRAFDLVVEVYTVQALPVTRRQATIAAIADTVAPGGELVAIAMTRNVHVPFRGIPWPLTEAELASFEQYGLTEVERVVQDTPTPERPGLVRLSMTRSPAG